LARSWLCKQYMWLLALVLLMAQLLHAKIYEFCAKSCSSVRYWSWCWLQVKVMHKQLLLFHNAVAAYFSGNQNALEATRKQFNIKLKPPNADKPSWLEQWTQPTSTRDLTPHGFWVICYRSVYDVDISWFLL